MPTTPMTDEEFLNYVEAHSKTERALFSAEHFERFWRLVGRTLNQSLTSGKVFRMQWFQIYDAHAEACRLLKAKATRPPMRWKCQNCGTDCETPDDGGGRQSDTCLKCSVTTILLRTDREGWLD